MFRGIYWDDLASLFRSPCAGVLTQALFFGLCHFRGFPSGFIGIGLSFLLGLVMGLIRLPPAASSYPLTTPLNLLN